MTRMPALLLRTLRALPDAVLRAVLPARLAFDGASDHLLSFADSPVRLLIGPVNFAGQAWAWARAAERIPGVTAVSMTTISSTGYSYRVDQAVPPSVFQLSGRWNRVQRARLREDATHVIVEAGRSLLGDGSTLSAELADLRGHGVRVALLGHGSDVRDGRRHAREFPDSPYHGGDWTDRDASERAAETHRAVIGSTGALVFVSTPGLLDDVPGATWLPVVIEADRWDAPARPLDAEVPLVVHAPSSTAIKGTELIEPDVLRLESEGLIRYRRIEGVKASEMPALLGEADIVLDQFRLGDYGVAACEAMAAGRVVIGNVGEPVRSRVRGSTGLELPIVQAEAKEIGTIVQSILADRATAREVADRARRFAREVHDGRRSAEVLRAFLES